MAYPDCIETLIGLRYCGADEPDSGYYINDLEGISLQFIAKLSDKEKETFAEVWEAVKKRVILKLPGEVMEEIRKCYQVKSLECVRELICEFIDEFHLPLMYRFGKELMIERLFSDTWNRWTQNRADGENSLMHYEAEFKTKLADWVRGIGIDPCERPLCFKCGGSAIHRGVMLP
jgi:ribulose bisphosphate carboxylase small subunit